MKRKLILFIGALFLVMTVSVGTFAYAYNIDSTRLAVAAAGGHIVTSEPTAEQPDWESLVPVAETDTEILLPNGQGDRTDIARQEPVEGKHWEKVSDLPSDDWYTYVYTFQAREYQRDLYDLTDRTEGFGTIRGVTVYFRFSGSDSEGGHIGYAKASIKTNGQIYSGTVESTVGQTFVNRAYQWTTNPETGEAWTWDEVDALQAGVALIGESQKYSAYCTQVFAEVEYLLAPITEGDVPAGDLFVITPHIEYTGDLLVNVYLTNAGDLIKAYQHLNIKLYVEDSLEAGEEPSYQVLSLENGVALFNIEGGTASGYTIEVTGGSYSFFSGYTDQWGEGWSITPEIYCEVDQR
ncbi:hypothetical protein ACFLWG_04125 [Chloroflexota bacterium]